MSIFLDRCRTFSIGYLLLLLEHNRSKSGHSWMFRRRGGYRRVATTVGDIDVGEARQENPNLVPDRSRYVQDRSRYASEISSSLSLQILIYYNGLLSAAYFILEGGLVIEKVRANCCSVHSRQDMNEYRSSVDYVGPTIYMWGPYLHLVITSPRMDPFCSSTYSPCP